MLNDISLKQLADVCEGRLIGGDVTVSSISTDSRSIAAGDLYIALVGDNFDGNDYAQDAIAKGASAVIVSRVIDGITTPQILVTDGARALAKIAQWHRLQWAKDIVAITGSCGKTTVKGMVASILSEVGNTLATSGNLNNHIGVPKTLLRLQPENEFAVIEMGASAVGEIGYLVQLAKPQVALVNNVVPAHLEGFGSIEAIASTKGEIYQGLTENGTAIVNLDDRFAGQWLKSLGKKSWLGFSVLDHSAEFHSTEMELDDFGRPQFVLNAEGKHLRVQLNVLGRSNVANALAAAACSAPFGATPEQMKAGLEKFSAVPGRLVSMQGVNQSRVIDDSYNANPGSVKAAIDVLAELSGDKILVLGEMGELGDEAEAAHREIGRYAVAAGINYFYGTGHLCQEACREFGPDSFYFDTKEALVQQLLPALSQDSAVLVKGSRSSAMDTVVSAITEAKG
jgi:UDP-N-acetylmuramoyl-tripeptide--D-alanyl-D-alanine ligase